MQFAFSLATGIIWTWVALFELTATFPDIFTFSPIRSALIAGFGVTALVIATMEYLWQLWFARVLAATVLLFLIISYWFPLMPENATRTPMIVALVIWIIFAVIAGYEKPPSSIAHVVQK